MENTDIRSLIVGENTDIKNLLNFCSTNTNTRQECSKLSFWTPIYIKYEIPLPVTVYTNASDWIYDFIHSKEIVDRISELLVNRSYFLPTDPEIVFETYSQIMNAIGILESSKIFSEYGVYRIKIDNEITHWNIIYELYDKELIDPDYHFPKSALKFVSYKADYDQLRKFLYIAFFDDLLY